MSKYRSTACFVNYFASLYKHIILKDITFSLNDPFKLIIYVYIFVNVTYINILIIFTKIVQR